MTTPRNQSETGPLPDSTRQLKELIDAAVKSGSVNLNVFMENEDWIAIEGTRASLEFLGNLLLTFARAEGDSFLNLDTECLLFKPGSEGIILYRKS